jgi:N-acetylmuramoyl-L-alanine amidase
MELSDRANELCQCLKCHYSVSMHINAWQGTGFESYFYNFTSTTSRKYRDILHNRVYLQVIEALIL